MRTLPGIALLVLTAGCAGTSSAGVGATAASTPPAKALATLDDGSDPSADDVARWQARLGLLSTYCNGNEWFLSDTIVQAHKVAHEHGADVSYTDTAIGITREASASGGRTNQDCDKLAAAWVTETVGR